MPRSFFLFTFLFLATSASVCQANPPSDGGALTLEDCYKLALQQSEQIALRQELIAQAESRFTQALSGILPRVSFSSSDKRQDGSGGSAFTLRKVPERKFIFSQPLFAGFKEFAAMAATKAERRQRIQEKTRAEQLLLLDVADAFYLLLAQQEDAQTLEATRAILVERIDELKSREALGRSRLSEVVSATAQLYRAEAELELVRSRQIVAQQLLEFLTGREPIGQIRQVDPALAPLESQPTYLTKTSSRADVQAAEEALQVAEQAVRVAKAEYWPTVGLEGNYYLERVGASKDVSWDAALKVDVPIFEGGQTRGAVAEAASQASQAKLRLSETRRKAFQEIKDAYANYQSAVGRNVRLGKALDASQQSFGLQQEEYRRSLVSNLEVLQALQDLQESRRELIQVHYEAKRLYWRLKVVTGEGLQP